MCLQSDTPREVHYPARTILVGEDVSGVELMEVPHERLVGVVSARGSGASHVAIIARAMGIPAVLGVTDLPTARMEDREVVVDGYRGRVYVSAAAVLDEYRRLLEEERQLSLELEELKGQKAETTDGIEVPLPEHGAGCRDAFPGSQRGRWRWPLPYRTAFYGKRQISGRESADCQLPCCAGGVCTAPGDAQNTRYWGRQAAALFPFP